MVDKTETEEPCPNTEELFDEAEPEGKASGQLPGDIDLPDDGQAERQWRYEEALAQQKALEAEQDAADAARDRKAYRQFVAGQVLPTLVAKADVYTPVNEIADNAVFLADSLIAALDRADAATEN